MVITQHLISIEEGGKREVCVLSHIAFAGSSVQGRTPNKGRYLSVGTLSI